MSLFSLFNFPGLLRRIGLRRLLRWSLTLLFALLMFDLGYLYGIWPDWGLYKRGAVQQSSFIRQYISERDSNDWPRLRWQPKPISQISKNMIRALIVAEDASFYAHSGIDLEALQAAMEYNLSEKRFVYGGSTISQQTVKNVFLTPSRNPIRKWHELVLTIGMERNLSKRRILEIYLNVAEFGRGIYGVEAAARHYWGVTAARLSVGQAIQLAASLPAPTSHNPKTKTRFFNRRVRKISRYF